jgi:hypothetical protein
MQLSRLPLAAFALVVLATSGCFSPYLRKAPNTPEPAPSPALVSGLVVAFNDGGGQKSLLSAVVDTAQNSALEAFGKKATTMMETKLVEHGYTLAFDQARTRTLDAFQIKSDSTTAALTGQWRHPDASYWTPQMVESLFVKPADIVGKVKVDGQKEYFAFSSVSIWDGGNFFKEPWVTVRIAIFDQDAKKVLELGGVGQGESQFFFSDRGVPNLELALTRAFDQLKTVKLETL